ncbi:SRPBCC family protein [Floridanema aerugineum]|uniref:SRPBCC family protein n=1 Tax=Floridaenema aerugineum BLCC-F46 TaxID=3153654 RepID=A0ABV4XGA0_9CYAN
MRLNHSTLLSAFPNLFLSLFPDYVMVHRLLPQSKSETQIVCEWLFSPESFNQTGFNPSDAVRFWDRVNQQDWQVCELMQAGVSSRAYTPGPYSSAESLLAQFDREFLRLMGH